ncbi:MAG TPA: ATP-binding protein [Candidatus Hydrogenedentes bacterium]|nr:ATP-binding protein [Candidatus Hydrogenedentota bacterium]
MTNDFKGRSPFYPTQPVPVELFVGRRDQINEIIRRGAVQVEAGKPAFFYLQGEYGIGKSSLAWYVQHLAAHSNHLMPLYATLGGAASINDVGAAILRAAASSGSLDPGRVDKMRDWLVKYVGEQSLFGITIRADALKREGPSIAQGPLPFFHDLLSRVKEDGVRGIFLVLDEINGIATQPQFAHFLKDLVDSNALSRKPVPLLLMLCGTKERRLEIVRNHAPVERIFDVINTDPLSKEEMKEFFAHAFETVNIKVAKDAMNLMIHFSAGFPRIMHLIGDFAFWRDEDGVISSDDAFDAVMHAAEDLGVKHIDAQVYRALQSKDYQSILRKIALTGLQMSFSKKEIEKGLTVNEKRKLNNFLQRMKKLNVIRSGEVRGEYEFISRMVLLYIWLKERTASEGPSN